MKLSRDQFPNYNSAGFKKDTKDQSTAVCVQPPERNVQTPQQIQHYRKSFKQQIGTTIAHYGHAKDPLPNQHHTYGIATQKCEGVHSVLKAGSKEGVNHFVNNIKEAKYREQIKQPLARTIDRKYNFPQQAKDQNFKFGLPTEKNKYDVKQTIYSGENMPEDQQIRKMYLKSHKDYDPGQQKNRQFNWNVDPKDFRFGKVQNNIYGEMKQVMSPENNTQAFQQTKFIRTNQNDFINRKEDKLGKPANLGQKQFPPQHAFGVRIQPNEWGAGKCINGQANNFQVRPDDNLGKATKSGWRNTPKEGHQQKVFGIPTIRYDIKKPAQQSLADPNNYADETTAIQLLFPQQQAFYQIQQKDYDQPRPKAQIKQLFENIGVVFRGNIFDAIFERSKAIHGTILDKVSCRSFKAALYELAH